MWYLSIALFALIHACRARQAGFSIHEDILAHPQFDVIFSESYILEHDARVLINGLNHRDKPSGYRTDVELLQQGLTRPKPPSDTDGNTPQTRLTTSPRVADDTSEDGDGSAQVSETFEIMHVPPSRYLCSVPVLAPPAAPNQTATELARAEEAKELSRASSRGVELISGMEGECLYYVSGWWSYSFCYGQEIVQFHALTTKAGRPVKDPHSQEYVLGRMRTRQVQQDAKKGHQNEQRQQKFQRNSDLDVKNSAIGNEIDPHNTELQVKGDQRFMVQHVAAGTICDLTGRERTIEIQYHCNPGGTSDRISWIKEVTTCAYLMEIRTPRLCEEEAFLPPKPAHAHPISCRLIITTEEAASRQEQVTIESQEAMQEAHKRLPVKQQEKEEQTAARTEHDKAPHRPDFTVGGVVVGARETLGTGGDGQPLIKLPPPQGFVAGSSRQKNNVQVVKLVAKAASRRDGGKVEVLSKDEISKLGLSPSVIEELCEKLHNIAEGKAWKLEAVEVSGQSQLELRAILEPEEDDEPNSGAQTGDETAAAGKYTDAEDAVARTKYPHKGLDEEEEQSEEELKLNEGSEETFKKDEL